MKQDLNLIPRKEDTQVVSRVVVPALLILLIFVTLIYTGIMIPKARLRVLEAKNNGLSEKITALSDVQTEYQTLMATLDTLKSQSTTMNETNSTDKQALEVFYMIEDAAPSEVVLTNVSLTEESIILQGTAPTDSLVAQFMVNLRDTDKFSVTNITAIQPEEVNFARRYEAEQQGEELPTVRNFKLMLIYPVPVEPEEEGAKS